MHSCHLKGDIVPVYAMKLLSVSTAKLWHTVPGPDHSEIRCWILHTNILSFVLYSGESMENALRACCKGIKIGKILIHRDGDNGKQVEQTSSFFFG